MDFRDCAEHPFEAEWLLNRLDPTHDIAIVNRNRYLLLAWCLTTFALSASHAVSDETGWNQWRGSHRDGSVDAAEWPDALKGKLTELWHHDLAPSYSGPVIADGLVFTTETVDKKSERVSAYDLQTGKVAWSQQWLGSMSVPFFAAANGDWMRSTPVAVPGSLIVLGMQMYSCGWIPKQAMTCGGSISPKNSRLLCNPSARLARL